MDRYSVILVNSDTISKATVSLILRNELLSGPINDIDISYMRLTLNNSLADVLPAINFQILFN